MPIQGIDKMVFAITNSAMLFVRPYKRVDAQWHWLPCCCDSLMEK